MGVCFSWVNEPNHAPIKLECFPNVRDNEVGEEHLNEVEPPSVFPSNPTTETSFGLFDTSNVPFEAPPGDPPSTVPHPSTVSLPSTIPLHSCVPLFDPLTNHDSSDDELEDDLKCHEGEVEYDETNISIREILSGKLKGDEPYYLSDEIPSFEYMMKHVAEMEEAPNRIVFDETCEKIVWKLGLTFRSIEKFRSAITRYIVLLKIQIEK
ncbi:hypothetical protein H5410_022160 [Solanum commersonii]|uniref:Uncharacterized protein n=1 Tax=Solanum commersonii TaxID=4109 RepID=A0A9J5ZFZ1_SOLCO|nr:hypothetical protein H5410_022160 [Solanum commersonii]